MPVPAKLIALACATALCLTPTLARANAFAPPSEAESPMGSPTPSDAASAKPSAAPAKPTSAPAMSATSATVPAPCLDDSLSLNGRNLWTGLEHATIKLELHNGKTIEGTLVGQDHEKLAIARLADGSLVAVPKRDIEGVQLLATPDDDHERRTLPPLRSRPTDDGRKMYGAGVGMLTIGIPLGVSGTALMGIFLGGPYIYLPVLVPGLGFIIGGSIAIKRSYQRQAAYRKAWGLPATAKLRLAPTLSANRQGGQLGVAMRF